MNPDAQAIAQVATWEQHHVQRAAANAAAALRAEVGQEVQSQSQARAAMKAMLSANAAYSELPNAACLSCAFAFASLAKYSQAVLIQSTDQVAFGVFETDQGSQHALT